MKSFFDELDKGFLIDLVAKEVADGKVLTLIKRVFELWVLWRVRALYSQEMV